MGRVALIFGLSKERRGSIPAAVCDRGATPLRTKSSATRRANELWAVWRRCALLTDHRAGGGKWGGRRMGEQAGMLVACALPFDPKLIRAAHTYFLDGLLQH